MARALAALAGREFDLLVVGAGITGAATAWDAAQRGLSVALLERGDFGGGTSAESLKVVHGGVRYLQHLDIVRVRESSRERRALLRMAPHLVHPMPFVVPTYGHGMRGPEILGAAFTLLNLLTADRNRGLTDPTRRVPAARIVSRARLLEWFPEVNQEGLTGAGVFYDGQLFNPPRLVWAMVRTAARAGAAVANYCDVTALLLQGGRVAGVRVEDRLGGEKFEVRARTVVNAAGPYAEALLVRSGVRAARSVPFSRDMALVLKRQFVNGRALALQTRYRDPSAVLTRGARHLFMVPWRGKTLVGVNSLIWRDEPDSLRVTEAEVSDFVSEIAEADPKLGLTLDDVALVMAGLLPVEKGDETTGNVSFGKRPLVVDNARTDGVQGLVSAISNRYTVARGVAERAVDLVYRKLGREVRRCRTEVSRIHGGDFFRFDALVREVSQALPEGVDRGIADRLARDHGSAYGEVLRLARERPEWGVTIGGTGILRAEVVHAARSEMVCRLSDAVFGRTGVATVGDPGTAELEECADLVAAQLGWDASRREQELRAVRERIPFRRG
ncbi:MAG TPA: glycerol-3-phosphate dehydrogenase/oxidase [Gemmatimonadales bacterium]|jgi:glycerol-3-phosphate dehydrogenase|nr:glycerol-3-phosphate dehydrogenase/oxidase [Gemmatimonadales bacterium]